MRVQMDSSAKELLDILSKKRGMTRVAVMSRLVHWFSRQDDFIQTSVLQILSQESMAILAKSKLKQFSK